MKFLNLDVNVQNIPELDPDFLPCGRFFAAYAQQATQEIAIALERSHGDISVYRTKICGTAQYQEADALFLDRLVKFLLWSRGGYRVVLCGCGSLGEGIVKAYAPQGSRAFDRGFMERVYERSFVVEQCPLEECPAPVETPRAVGGHLKGCRIGFDAGGSDRKVSAVVDGEPIFSEEVVWFPKEKSDPDYHFAGIVEALHTAAAKMPRVDAVGISSAGIYVDDRCMVASLFNRVPLPLFEEKVKDIYARAVTQLGENIPFAVCNDGDVTALAGSMGMGKQGILGIAMGTSEAVGYADGQGRITGWLNELAFAPVDCRSDAPVDEWSGDRGCGVKYLSQDGVILLAERAGMVLEGNSPAEKLKEVQELLGQGSPVAKAIYRSMGVYLGHALGFYSLFYDIQNAMLLGRVMSGLGGDILLAEAERVLQEEYAECHFPLFVPDEKTRRVGQSIAAASLAQSVEG